MEHKLIVEQHHRQAVADCLHDWALKLEPSVQRELTFWALDGMQIPDAEINSLLNALAMSHAKVEVQHAIICSDLLRAVQLTYDGVQWQHFSPEVKHAFNVAEALVKRVLFADGPKGPEDV